MKGLSRDATVLQDGVVLEQRALLERTGQSPARDKIGPALADRNAVQQNLTARRREPSGDEIEQGRLSGAVGADHRTALAFGHREVQAGNHFKATIGLGELADFERAHRHLPVNVRNVPATPPRKNATTSMKKIPKNRLYSPVRRLSPCLTRTKTAAPTKGPRRASAPPMMTMRMPSPLDCHLMESGLMK